MEEEIEFLRDQVYRLNSVLAFYQSKSPSLKEDQDGLYPSDGQAPEWLKGKMRTFTRQHRSRLAREFRQNRRYNFSRFLGRNIDKTYQKTDRFTDP